MWRPAIESESHAGIGQVARDAGVLPRPLRVLVVDYDTGAADSLERLLHATGCLETRVAYTGHGAVALAREFRPQVALVELGMPEIDNRPLSQALRERTQSRTMCLIAISGRRAHHEAQIERSATFAQCLFKPITARDLSACLIHAAAGFR
jgi:CheY-like chemotaxis protein